MNQGHRRHGSGGYTLLYYIGLEGKGRGTAAGQDRAGSAVYGTRERGRMTEEQGQGGKRDGRTEGQKKKKKGKEDRRQKTEEQKNKNRWKGEQEKGGTRTGKSP